MSLDCRGLSVFALRTTFQPYRAAPTSTRTRRLPGDPRWRARKPTGRQKAAGGSCRAPRDSCEFWVMVLRCGRARANPSHLEIVDPVCLGKVRAKQDQNGDAAERTTVLPLLIHGDAAFAGQGVVAECFGLSGLKGFRTGGSVHFIINNQIGFTTNPRYSRSSPYPSDLAKMIEAPIFHVNGDDPEAVVRVAKLAIEFRQTFHKPVVIDMFCFRLYGHNEGDEPAFTQPEMYKAIRSHKSTLEIYGERLVAEGVVTGADIDRAKADWIAHLDDEFAASQSYRPNKADWLDGRWTGLKPIDGEADDKRPRPVRRRPAPSAGAIDGGRATPGDPGRPCGAGRRVRLAVDPILVDLRNSRRQHSARGPGVHGQACACAKDRRRDRRVSHDPRFTPRPGRRIDRGCGQGQVTTNHEPESSAS